MTPAKTYRAQLEAAKRRRETALKRLVAAREAMAREDALIHLFTARVESGAGHVPLPDPDILAMTFPKGSAPRCRVCGSDISSISGKQPCRGDTRRCPAMVGAANSTTYQRYGEEGYRCGAAGQYDDDFRAWTCVHGHETLLIAASFASPKHCSHDSGTGWQRQCLSECPSWGLNSVTPANAT